jgi:hypothetical protein
MADDAGALLVRSGLVPSSALDDARVRVASLGGTLGEQLVWSGSISDDALTDFYRSRLLVPQVNPNTLARLPVRVVSAIPSDMAIELRAIPVSLDGDNNLTVAMSDPSDSHAVDEIAFFTGTYVVRAVATQMQIAWCLAHYYGHVTALGQKLLQPTGDADPTPTDTPAAPPEPRPEAPKPTRVKGHTSKIEAARHRAIVPVTGPVQVQARPNSKVLDDPNPQPPRENPASVDGVPERPRARSISGEIRIPGRRASSIKPVEEDPYEGEDSAPVITIEVSHPDEDPTGPRKVPPKRRVVKTDPPELYARAGEVDVATGPITRVDLDEPRIIINDDSPTGADVSGELKVVAHRDQAAPATTIEVDDTSVGVIIHEHYKADSEPVPLEKRARTDAQTNVVDVPDVDDDGDEIVVLEAVKAKPRPEKKTQMGIVAGPVSPRSHRDTEASSEPVLDDLTGPTQIDGTAAPDEGDYSDEIVAPPPPATPVGLRDDDTSPHVLPPGIGKRPQSAPSMRANTSDDEDDHRYTAVMSAVELDEAIPERDAEIVPAHLADRPDGRSGELTGKGPAAEGRKIDYDPIDDGWGPPGTTIPPPLLGAIPGSDDGTPSASQIPVSDLDSAPLIVAPPTPPEPARAAPTIDVSPPSLVRALETATSRSIELIHALERAQSRDEVISLMSAHLAHSHRRAGFFSIKSGELALFSMVPKAEINTGITLRLDRPSTLQDVVGTRLPYRGPMHDDASRNFLTAVLGVCPSEILLVPVAVRERVVGVLFGEHRYVHTFDDQLALAARAAGMALERILKAKPR